jgi:ABC-type transport system involved in multi-copper enzyme maturation permease subunit
VSTGALGAIARFEFATKLTRISTWVYFSVFAAVALLWMAAAGGAFASANVIFSADKVFINSPYAIAQTVTFLGMLGTVVIAAFMGRAVQQDFETLAFAFFFTSPITKAQYLFGRFIGAALVLMLIFVGIALGVLLGTHLPGVDATRVGPWSIAALVEPYFVMLLPNVLVLGAMFFALGALGRRMLPVYIAGVVVLVGYLIAGRLLADIDNRTVAALIDPMGSIALGVLTRYWSPDEKNQRLVPVANELLWNRALWLGVGVAAFAVCFGRFRVVQPGEEAWRRGRKARALEAAAAQAATPATPRAVPQAVVRRATGDYARQLPGVIALYLRETVKSPYFVAIVLTGALFILGNARVVGSIYGTNTYPVTYQVLEFASGTFGLFVLIVTAFYAGELVWRERDARVAQIADSLPTPTWLGFTAKLVTLFAMQALLQLVVMACGIAIQLASGYTHLELGQYLYRLFALQLPGFWMIAVLALTVHALVNHKYLGHFIVVLYYLFIVAAVSFGWQDRLYLFGGQPAIQYSDMNGYGHFIPAVRWFQLYWGAACIVLLVVARLAWVRGTDVEWRARLQRARSRLGIPLVATAVAAGVVFLATGAWIFYNTHVLNPYRDENKQEALRADYEKRYKAYATHPQPKVVGVKVDADIRPEAHDIRFRGEYQLRNRNPGPVTELLVNLPEEATVHALAASIPLKLEEERRDLSWRRFGLAQPLPPGGTMTLSFDLEYAARGFTNSGASKEVVDNGTFVNSGLLPVLGYQGRMELSLDRERKKHGLEPKERMPSLDAPGVRDRNYISSDGDWITFETTVSTDPDQVAIAPGYLQKEWTGNGRRHFHYAMDVPILDFYAFLSARYAVKRDAWHGPRGDVPIEIYYQPGHEYDLDAMIAGVKDGLAYDSANFGPYQHHQVRILEFPRYASFAQSFPNTIPFSEAIGFIAKVKPKDPKDIDYPYYVTAHEIAHQWWAHQVIGAYAQGATMMSETLAQYSALMVMKHKYGDAKMARFLKYELDSYLVGRATERKSEQPLYRNENQPYIHYRKGSLAMYALQDAIGEDAVNRALASFVRKWAFKGPPYPLSTDLLAELRAVTPPEYQGLLADLFEKITLYENRAISATSRPLASGHYEVTLKVSARKLYADGNGAQKEAPMDEWVDIGVIGAGEEPLYLEKHRVRSGESTFTIDVAGKPVKAGIDPVVKLVDRRPEDNTVPVN